MDDRNISRSEFLRQGSCLAALGVFGGCAARAQASSPDQSAAPPAEGQRVPLVVRPGDMLCLLCSLGDEAAAPQEGKLADLAAAIRTNADVPISLCCRAGVGFDFQSPPPREDGNGGRDFHDRRDLLVLQRLDMTPGETLPARILIHRLLKLIPSVQGICGFDVITSDAWKGCPKAAGDGYARGCQRAAVALIAERSEEEMAAEKKTSIEALRKADVVRVRPHIVVCAICQYGGGTRPPYKPDNLPELLELILGDRPDLAITLVQGADWMMCAPCPFRNPATGWCVVGNVKSGGLYNEVKDLNILQRLGLTYGATMNARELYHRIFEKIPSVVGVCVLESEGKSAHSVWRDGCGAAPEDAQKLYLKGVEALRAKLT